MRMRQRDVLILTWICNRITSRSGTILHRAGFLIPVDQSVNCAVVAVESSCKFSVAYHCSD